MSVDHLTWFVIPLENFTEGRFAKTMDSLRHLPNSMIAPYNPADPDAPLFSTGTFPSPVIDGIDTYGFGASTQWDPEEEFKTSLPYGVLDLMAEGKQFFDNDLLSDAYAEVLGRIFTGMGAVYACCGSNQSVSSISELLEVTSGLHIFSDEMVEAIGREVLEESGFVTEIDRGLIVRTNEEDIYGGAYGKIGIALSKVEDLLGVEDEESFDVLKQATQEWDGPIYGESAGFSNDPEDEIQETPKDMPVEVDMCPSKDLEEGYEDHVTDEPVEIDVRGVPPPVDTSVRYKEFMYSPYSPFILLYCREATDMRTASVNFFRDLMAFEASEEVPDDKYWLRPERLDELVDQLSYGEKIICRFKRSFTTPSTHLHSAQLEMAVLAGLPGQPSCGPQYERDGAISIFIGHSWGNLESLTGIEGLTLMLQVLQVFTKHFRPVYGMGVRAFESFIADSNQQVSPDSQIWPVNVFDLDVLGHEFEARLRDYHTQNADRWMLQDLEGRTVVFMAYDPESKDRALYEEATKSIFGDLQDLSGPIAAHLLGTGHHIGGE